MLYDNWGWGWGGWLLMALVMIVFWAAVITAVVPAALLRQLGPTHFPLRLGHAASCPARSTEGGGTHTLSEVGVAHL